jgi:GH43 family beta-xylosidase
VPTTEDFYAIDGTVLQHIDGQLYFIWSGSHNLVDNFPQKLFITTMLSPTSLSGPRVLLRSASVQPWESKVNEGPEIIQRNNRTFIIFSNYCEPEGGNANYCLCIMWLEGARDPVDPGNWWHKITGPVFWRNDEESVYGPGHASFTYSPGMLLFSCIVMPILY